MARIPFAAIQGGTVSVDAPPLQRANIQPDPSAGADQAAIARVAGVTADVGDKLLAARNTVEVSKAINASALELDQYRTELDKDPDYASRAAKFEARAREIRDRRTGELTDPRAASDFTLRFDTQSRAMQLQVQHEARDQELQDFKLQLGQSLDQLATRAVMARSEPERVAIQEEAKASIVDAVRTGRMSAVQASTLSRAYLGKVDAALASEMIRTSPSAAIAALGDPERFKNLDASARVALRAQATNRAESLGAQARAELRADIHDFTAALVAGQPVGQDQKDALLRRAGGPKSAQGALLQRTWDFYQRVNAEGQDKNIPQLAATIANLTTGAPVTHDSYPARKNADGTVSTMVGITVTDPRLNGGAPTNIPSLWEGKQVDQGEAITRALRSGKAWPSFATIDEAVQASVEASRAAGEKIAQPPAPTPQDLHLARVLQATLQRKVAERDQDPAAYALKYHPTINESLLQAEQLAQSGDAMDQNAAPEVRARAWSALIDAQRRNGVPEHRLSLLTAPQADDLRHRLASAEGQNRVDLVEALRGQYGEQWPRVVNQLYQGKPAPADIQVMAALPPGANLDKVQLAEAFKIKDADAAQILGKTSLSTISDKVRSAVEEMAPTMVQAPDGPSYLATYAHAIEKLAQLHAIRGESEAAAVKRAAQEVFYDHWDVQGTLRVPKTNGQPVAPASAVRQAQQQVIDALPKMDIAVPAGEPGMTAAAAKEALLRNVRSFGYWMTTADDRGMVLMAGPGLPVRFADGQPLVVPFDSVLAAQGNQAALDNLLARTFQGRAEGSDQAPPAAGVPRWMEFLVRPAIRRPKSGGAAP